MDDEDLQSAAPTLRVTNTVVYMRIVTRTEHNAMDRGGRTSVAAFWFGGLSRFGMTPAGGTPAGPLSKAVILSDIAKV